MCRSSSWIFAILAAGFSLGCDVQAEELRFASKTTATHLLELFTSEGCSSCPPAETWLGKLRNDDRLWQEFIPVVFHVDYWDGLGWKDRFAQPEWTRRQRAYADRWRNSSVYTPGFALDGREWQNWAGKLSFSPGENAGLLVAIANGNNVRVSFQPVAKFSGGSAHVAWLGFNLLSNVRAGENEGRSLRHDFVVLRHATAPLIRDVNGLWKVELTSSEGNHEETGAIACWVETDGVPVQATGGWLAGAKNLGAGRSELEDDKSSLCERLVLPRRPDRTGVKIKMLESGI
jgi:hypothetical protein